MNKNLLSLISVVGALALSVVPASAGILTYATSGAWQGAGLQTGIITFESVTIPANYSSFAIPPLTFSSTLGNSLSIANDVYGPGSGKYLLNASPTNIAADGTVFGLAFNFRCYSCDGRTATITVVDSSGPTAFSVATTSTGISNFFGIRSDLAITSVNISFSGATPYVALDNVAYGPGSDTPEAATLILIGTGLGIIARYRKHAIPFQPA